MRNRPLRIISGGQTGADRGGLDAAIALGIPHGGWCPKGRRAEDGVIPAVYELTETASAEYLGRTRRNVGEADGTVVFTYGPPTGGSLATIRLTQVIAAACLVLKFRDLDQPEMLRRLRHWMPMNGVRTLNVAGSRESKVPGIQAAVKALLVGAFA